MGVRRGLSASGGAPGAGRGVAGRSAGAWWRDVGAATSVGGLAGSRSAGGGVKGRLGVSGRAAAGL
ncbi:MAG: hypothetical protein FJ291_28175 [Planctomycetes bacterium]|nr:hypothetical protein [Planctomycetota bacterium]